MLYVLLSVFSFIYVCNVIFEQEELIEVKNDHCSQFSDFKQMERRRTLKKLGLQRDP